MPQHKGRGKAQAEADRKLVAPNSGRDAKEIDESGDGQHAPIRPRRITGTKAEKDDDPLPQTHRCPDRGGVGDDEDHGVPVLQNGAQRDQPPCRGQAGRRSRSVTHAMIVRQVPRSPKPAKAARTPRRCRLTREKRGCRRKELGKVGARKTERPFGAVVRRSPACTSRRDRNPRAPGNKRQGRRRR